MLALARFPEEKWAKASRTGAKVAIQMRFSNPLLLASFGVLFVAASCTLITDVDRSKIPDGVAGTPPGDAGSPSQPQGGDTNGGSAPVTMGGSETMGGTGTTPMGGGGGAAGELPIGGGGGAGGMVDVGGAGAGGQTPVDPTAGAAGTVP